MIADQLRCGRAWRSCPVEKSRPETLSGVESLRARVREHAMESARWITRLFVLVIIVFWDLSDRLWSSKRWRLVFL